MSLRFCVALSIIILFACADLDAPINKSIEKAAQIALREKLGRDVKAKMTADGIIISGRGAEYTISFSATDNSATRSKRPPNDLPLFPGALVTAYFKGVGEDTIRLSAPAPAEDIGQFYQKAFKRKGFAERSSITGEGDFAGSWVSPGSGFGVQIYSYKEEDHSQIVMIVSRAGEAEN